MINETSFTYDNRTEPEKFETKTKVGDIRYVPLFDLKLLAGRNFRTNYTMAHEIIVNEMMVKRLGLKSPNDIMGKRINVCETDYTVVGVVKDFHVNSLRKGVTPTVIFQNFSENRMAALKLSSTNLPEIMKQVETVWDDLFPEHVFHYQFMDEILDRFYIGILADRYSDRLPGAVWAGIIHGRIEKKEIGVRKTLGTSTFQVLWLFGREFGRLILLGFLLAAPLGWWLMRAWLQDYTYRIQLGWWFFRATILMATLITLITISFQSLKAAFINPVTSLRSE